MSLIYAHPRICGLGASPTDLVPRYNEFSKGRNQCPAFLSPQAADPNGSPRSSAPASSSIPEESKRVSLSISRKRDSDSGVVSGCGAVSSSKSLLTISQRSRCSAKLCGSAKRGPDTNGKRGCCPFNLCERAHQSAWGGAHARFSSIRDFRDSSSCFVMPCRAIAVARYKAGTCFILLPCATL